MDDLEVVKHLYSYLSESNKLFFLEWIYENNRHKWDFATMPDSLRNFYDANKVRPGDTDAKKESPQR